MFAAREEIRASDFRVGVGIGSRLVFSPLVSSAYVFKEINVFGILVNMVLHL